MKTHAEIYKGFEVAAFVHRARLRSILAVLAHLKLSVSGLWANFGCSDGFILQRVSMTLPLRGWQLYGFDCAAHLLAAAREQNIPRSEFANAWWK